MQGTPYKLFMQEQHQLLGTELEQQSGEKMNQKLLIDKEITNHVLKFAPKGRCRQVVLEQEKRQKEA